MRKKNSQRLDDSHRNPILKSTNLSKILLFNQIEVGNNRGGEETGSLNIFIHQNHHKSNHNGNNNSGQILFPTHSLLLILLLLNLQKEKHKHY